MKIHKYVTYHHFWSSEVEAWSLRNRTLRSCCRHLQLSAWLPLCWQFPNGVHGTTPSKSLQTLGHTQVSSTKKRPMSASSATFHLPHRQQVPNVGCHQSRYPQVQKQSTTRRTFHHRALNTRHTIPPHRSTLPLYLSSWLLLRKKLSMPRPQRTVFRWLFGRRPGRMRAPTYRSCCS